MIYKAEFLLPGILFPESTTRVLVRRDPYEALAVAPEGSYCFTLFDTADEVDAPPGYSITPTRQNVSGRYYIGGTVYTLAEVEALKGDQGRALVSNLRQFGDGRGRGILCRTGNWQPFTNDDVLLDEVSR